MPRLDLPPFRCSQHVAWPLGEFEHLVVDRGEVLHTRPGRQRSWGIYDPDDAETVAEALAEVLAPRDVSCHCGEPQLAAAWRHDPYGTYARLHRLTDELRTGGHVTSAEACRIMLVAAECRDEALDVLPKQVLA